MVKLCKRGLHELTEANVWIRPNDGRRYCRICRKVTRKLRKAENKAQQEEADNLYNAVTGERMLFKDLFWNTHFGRRPGYSPMEEAAYKDGWIMRGNGPMTLFRWPGDEYLKKDSADWHKHKAAWERGWKAADKLYKQTMPRKGFD